MSFGKSLGGLIRVRLISADPDGALQRIRRSGITAYNIERLDALTWRFSVNSTNVNIIQKLADQFGFEIECTESPGFFRTVIFLRKRFVFLLGMLMLVVLSFWVPSRVLFVEVQGNTQVSTREII